MQFSNMLAAAVLAFSATALALPVANPEVAENNAVKHDTPYDDKFGYDGKPLDASFCKKLKDSSLTEPCRSAIAECDKKFDNKGRENECRRNVKEKYQGLDKGYNGGGGYPGYPPLPYIPTILPGYPPPPPSTYNTFDKNRGY